MPGPCPQARAHMFVHVNCSGLAVGELCVCSEGASFANSTEMSRPQCLSCPQPTCQVPHASKQLQSVRQHRRDSIGLLQDLVQDQVDCTPEEQRRRERVDPERLLHAWHGRQSPAKEAFSFSTTMSGVQTQPGGGSQKPRAVHASDEPTEIYINVLLVGIAGHTVISYALTMNGCHFMSRARIICFIEKNHLYHTRATQEGRRLRHCGTAWAWAGSGRTWLDNT